jgi:recombination protein RecT
VNAIVPSQPSRLDEYRIQVLPADRAQDLYRSLPSHIKPAVFERNLVNALMANPSLMEFDPRLIFREVSKAAGLGLLLDPILGEAYIVTAYNYKSRKTEPQLRVGYKGMNKLARQSGNVTGIYAHEVHALDDVECDLGFPKVFHHRPKLFADRGELIGYVAVVTFKDGTFDFEPMSKEQCLAIRDRSDAWKAFKEGKIKSTPWATDEVEMSKKTVLRRLMKRQEQSPEMAAAIRIEDEAEHPEMSAPTIPPRPRVPSPNEVEQIEHQPADREEHPDHGSDKYRPGDVVDNKPDPITSGPQPNVGKSAPPVAAKKSTLPNLEKDYEGFVSLAIMRIATFEDGGALETFWNDEIAPFEDGLMPPDRDDLTDAYTKQQAKLQGDD